MHQSNRKVFVNCDAMRSKFLLVGLSASLLASLPCVAWGLTVGGFDASRTLNSGYSIYSPSGANTELNNVANWPLYGDAINIVPGTAAATSSYLAGVDVFFTGLLDFDAAKLSPIEVQSMTDFIQNGGVVIAHGDNLSFDETVDDLLNAFGLDVNNATNNTNANDVIVDLASHPVMNGPFGGVGTHEVRDSAHLLTATAPGEILTSYTTGQGAIGAAGPVGPWGGALIFFPDSETYGLNEADFRGQPEARRAFNNAIAWAVQVPEPASCTLAILGLGFMARRRRTL